MGRTEQSQVPEVESRASVVIQVKSKGSLSNEFKEGKRSSKTEVFLHISKTEIKTLSPSTVSSLWTSQNIHLVFALQSVLFF